MLFTIRLNAVDKMKSCTEEQFLMYLYFDVL